MPAKVVEELYRAVRQLPVRDRLQLAARILQDLCGAQESDRWSEEDRRDLTRASLAQIAQDLDDEG